ncbi:MAG TPA: hypothetical protein VHA74_02200 [Candidatus Dojkabacteria bacterium]|nr:hypothetical protein [Candidatus Dojkabacteria bacterium]
MVSDKSFNYHFLKKYLHIKLPVGFREDIALFIVSRNNDSTKNKVLLIKERTGFWGLPKRGITGNNLMEGLLNALVDNLGYELGLKGVVVFEKSPQFIQKAYFVNYAKQIYDKERSEHEQKKDRPSKGKIYHLIILDYWGDTLLPIDGRGSTEIEGFEWVDFKSAEKLLEANLTLEGNGVFKTFYESFIFNIEFFKKSVRAYEAVEKLYSFDKETSQLELLQ